MHTTAPEHTAEHYQIQATIALDNCNYELAKQILDKAANIHVSNPFILELLGIAEMECASLFQYDESKSYIDRAIACFYESIQIAPNVGYAKYLYLGQFTCGLESLAYSEKGLIILEKQYLQSFDIDVQSLDVRL